MIVIGVDTHKRTHALVAVDEGTGRRRGRKEILANEDGQLMAVRWARDLDEGRVWAIEDCRQVSRRLEQALLAAGEHVVRVAPHLMGASRRGERQPGKSDEIDALAIARAVVRDGVEEFPVAYLDERAMEVRLLSDHRKGLVAERTRMVQRLRWHLVELCPELEMALKRRELESPRAVQRLDRRLRALPGCARLRIARSELAHIRSLTREIDELRAELAELVKAQRPWLLEEVGCGPLHAAVLIGHTAGAERFKSASSFALQTGTAPIPCSSGLRTQHRLNRGGDRQLNSTLHMIAICRSRVDPESKAYLARKLAEGKTKRGALRSLKRSLARRFYHHLTRPPLDPKPEQPVTTKQPQPARSRARATEPGTAAPSPMICIT